MSLAWGFRHSVHGLISALLTVVILVTKGITAIVDVVIPGPIELLLDLLLYHLPVAVFESLGAIAASITGIEGSPLILGLLIGKPIIHAAIPVIRRESFRSVISHWIIHTAVIALAVAASLGLAPDPVGAGSGFLYHLEHHTAAIALTDAMVFLGHVVATGGTAVFSVEIDESIGILFGTAAVAFVFGGLWERSIGHS